MLLQIFAVDLAKLKTIITIFASVKAKQ